MSYTAPTVRKYLGTFFHLGRCPRLKMEIQRMIQMEYRMRELLFMIILVLAAHNLFSEETVKDSTEYDPLSKHNSLYYSYANNLHSSNRISIGGAVPISSHYLINTDFIHVTWENEDKFNRMRRSTSLFSLLDIGSSIAISLIFPDLEKYFLTPIFLTNSTHNFYLLGNPDYTYDDQKDLFNLALFVKNSTDVYFFRKNNWLEVCPGAGVKLFVYGAAVDLGYERRHQFLEHERPKYMDGFYFNITMHIPYLE